MCSSRVAWADIEHQVAVEHGGESVPEQGRAARAEKSTSCHCTSLSGAGVDPGSISPLDAEKLPRSRGLTWLLVDVQSSGR